MFDAIKHEIYVWGESLFLAFLLLVGGCGLVGLLFLAALAIDAIARSMPLALFAGICVIIGTTIAVRVTLLRRY